MLRYYLFSKLSNYPSNMIFSTVWGFSALCNSSQTIFGQHPSKKIDGEGSTNSVAYSISRLDPCDFFLWGYLKDQVFRELTQSIPELKTKISLAIATIMEETLQKVFKNIENRLSFVIRQNGGHLENLLNY